jgi:hypothetical protein
VCLGFLHGAILGWIAGYFAAYFSARGSFVRRVYLDASKHCFIAFVIVTAELVTFFILFLPRFPGGGEGLYGTSFCVATTLFFLARMIKIQRDIDKYNKNWPQSVGRLETISYGSKRFRLSLLAIVIILLVLLFIG